MKIKVSIILLIFLSIIISCKYSKNYNESILYFCDAERTTSDNNYFLDKNNSKIKFTNNNTQSTEEVYSGKHSVKLDSADKYGMTIKIKEIKPGTKYKLSVFRYGNPNAYMIASISDDFYEKIGEKSKSTEKENWYLLEKVIEIPYFIRTNELSVYLWNTTDDAVFFDNLKIEQVSESADYHFSQTPLYIYIDEPEIVKLQEIKDKAFKKGILETTDNSWVEASMFYKNEDYKTELRFKGDWLDHLQGKKWSFRIKVKKGKTWKGMKTFSIQNPNSRHFLDEWFAHKIFESEDVLTTRYDFIPVYLNNKPLGLYAYEEHFEKQLVESRKRREGVILKFSEDQFWATYNVAKTTDTMPVYEASDIIPFKRTKTYENKALFKQFLIAQNLLYQYKYQLNNASDIFDVKQLAKYYALVSLTKMNHSIRWHNQRYYYNPVLSKLEIIAFDGYTPDGYMAWGGSIFGNFEINTAKNSKFENKLNYFVFTDSLFVQEYVKQLEIYSSKDFLKRCFSNNREQLKFFENEIQKEFIDYNFDTSFIYNNAKNIRKDLDIYKLKIKEGKYKNIHFKKEDKDYWKFCNKELVPYFINAYTNFNEKGEKIIRIENYLPDEITVLGFSENNLFTSEKVEPVIISQFNNHLNYKNIKTNYEQTNYLTCSIADIDSMFYIEIFPWNSPETETPLQSFQKNKIITNSIYQVSKGKIFFNKGKHIIKNTIIIPPEYQVIFEAGSNIDFVNRAAFISYSDIQMNGTATDKVIIQSSDNTAQGFTVLQANKNSKIEHTEFIGFNTLNFKGWTLTGAVNFYESDVIIKNTTIKNNVCEDALNIIRSKFIVRNCSFENIFSDAFDSDFSTGELTNTSFNKITNDAIDFSGSSVNISDCKITNAGDKGISGGENSTLTVNHCSISDSKIGIASKDKSTVSIYNCEINNCQYGLVAFQKKPEYGSASIISTNLTYSNLINFHLIEKKSLLQINTKKIPGYDKNTAKRFY